jgi:CheY-like chemotaxis protein
MAAMGAPASTERWVDPTLSGCTVLIVEDHADSAELLGTVLRSLRAHVVDARSISEAERLIVQLRPHLIVCDMRLPDGTGADLVRWLRWQRPPLRSTPVIGITVWDQYFPKSMTADFDAYMTKPVSLDKFCSAAVALARW